MNTIKWLSGFKVTSQCILEKLIAMKTAGKLLYGILNTYIASKFQSCRLKKIQVSFCA